MLKMERKYGTEVVLPFLPLPVKINSTYTILLFFFHSQRLMIRNFAVSIGVFISKHNQMPHLSHFEIYCSRISCSSEALPRHFNFLSCFLPYSCIFFFHNSYFKESCITFISAAFLSSCQAEICPTENN